MTTITIQLVAITCHKCGVVFGLTKDHQTQLVKSKGDFWCPNGHGNYYPENPLEKQIEKLKDKLQQEQEATEYWRLSCEAEEQEHKGTKRQLGTVKGQLTKTKKRIENGVCPCCQRTFKQLARHMRDKHPEYR